MLEADVLDVEIYLYPCLVLDGVLPLLSDFLNKVKCKCLCLYLTFTRKPFSEYTWARCLCSISMFSMFYVWSSIG